MKSARPLLRFVGTAAATLLAAASNAAEPDYAADLPRIPQVPPAAAAATMRVQPGFALDLAVHEPLVASPVAIAWDEDGRLFVAEMRGYSEQRGENLGRIRMLHDDDRDGRFDRATIFAEGLGWPTAVVVSRGGLFVGDAPDILRLVDTDDDGVADVRQTVFTGFGTGNVQGLFNSFAVGLDNRIHAAGSSVGGSIRRVDAEGRPAGEAVSIAGRDFSFDPRTLDLRPETGGAQHGRSTDDVGNVYVCHNSDHCIRCMVDDRFVSGNPFFPAPAAKVSVAVEGPQAAVYRASPVEPWRILRTRLRASGITPGLVEGGGRPAGYFTSATGITVVRGDAVGDLAGMLVVGDVGSNLVHRKRLTPRGAGVQAARVDRDGELVASTDLWFRPVQYANGPDGALWIVDMQREVIEHPQSLPPPIKKHLDLTSGRETGRLWRLVAAPRDRSQPHPPRRLPPRLSRATTPELVRLLAHANGWHRDTAHRLLVERADPAAASLLQAVCRDQAAPPLARLHAAHAAVGLGMLAVDDVLALLGAADARVRQCGVHVSDVLLAHESFPEPLGRRLATLADDEPAIEVRFSLALTARRLPDEARVAVVRRLLERDGDDDWVRYAAFTSLRGEAGMIIETWLRDPRTQSLPGVTAALPGLVAQVGRRRDAAELTRLIAALDGLVGGDATNAADAQTLATGLLEQLASAIGGTLDAIQPTKTTRSLVARLVSWNRGIALDTSADVEARLRGVRGLALGGVAELQPLLRTDTPARLLDAALAAIASSRDPEIGRVVALALPGLPAAQRRAAAAILVRDAQGATALLDAVAGGTMTATDLEPTTARALWSFPEATVARRSLELLGPPPAANREPLVAAYRASLPPEGDAVTGNAIFRKQCVSCHRVAGEGRELGPNLAAMQARGPDAMLLGILDPNREVLPAYLAHTAVTDDGRVVTGVVAEQSVGSLTLRTADGMDVTLARSDVESLVNTKRSLMPEGFEKTIPPKEMADLLAYLMSVK